MARVCGISSILLMIMVVLSSTFGVLNVVSDISGEVVEVLDQTISIEKNGNWTVTGNEIYTSESIDLNGNLSIFGTLVLDNTDLTLNSTCEGVPWIIVHNGGKLVVRNGSIVRGRSDIRYTFSSERTSSVLINHSIIRNCGLPVMEHWMMGIYTESKDFKVLNSKIENGGTGIVGAGACMDLCGTNVAEMDSWGVVLMNGSYLNASVVNITDCIDGGITTTNSTADLRMLYFENVMISLDVVGSVVNTTSSTLFGLTPISGLFNSSTVILERCMPSRFGGDLLKVANPMSGPTDLLMINSTFPEVLVLDMGADVRSSVLFDVVVHTNHDPPAGNADIEIKDRFGTIVYQGLANDDGRIEDMPIVVARYNTTNIIEMTPHNLSVKYEGGSRYKDFFANQHHSVEIDVILNDPEVSIDHPENGSWISSGEFFLKGRIMDRRSITDLWISIDGSPDVSVPNGDTFSIPLNLPDGHHSLGMTARNDDGKYGNSTVSFNIDTVFPELIITSPGSPFYTNTSNVMIEGTCSSDAELYIGLTRIPHPDGSFKTNPILDDGRNDITLRAVDRAGNAVSAHLTVFRDANPPVLLILSPLNGTRTSRDSIMVMGSVDEDTQRVFIDNEVVILADGKFEHDVALEHEGSNRIKIIAEDVTGTRTVKVISVIKDTTPPDVAITYAPSLTRNESITIRGTVDPGSTLLVNNRITAVDGGVFMTEVDLIEGENSIMVIAKDDLGNERAINRMIRLDTIAPILDRLEPPSGTHVTNPILQLHGEVYDEVGIGSVRGRVNDGPHQMISTQRNWTWVVTLEDGQNLLDLEVKDDAGNILFRQITYTLLTTDDGDTEPPTVVITEPRSNDSIETGILKVFGWALDDVGLASVEIRLDGGEWRPVTGLQSWEHEFDLMKGIYIIEVRAEDTSGNTAVDSIWVSVIIVDESQDDGKNEPSKWPLYFGLGVFLFLFTFLIGYLLFVRSSYREQQERMEYKGTGRGPIKGQRTVRTRERRRFPGEDGPLERPRGNRRRMDREEGS